MPSAHELVLSTPTDREIVLRRDFDAPRQAVFAAWTTPDLLRRWFGPHGHTLVECDVDLRVGGRWRYALRGPDGTDMVLRGVYREIDAPSRIVTTEMFGDGDDPDDPSIATATFDERDGVTTLTVTVVYATKEARDEMVRAGMHVGFGEGLDRLETFLDAPD